MARRRRVSVVPCLVLVAVFFYTWQLLNDHLLPGPPDDRSRLLTEDALRAARDSVDESMQALLAAYEDEMRTISGRNSVNNLGTKFERLQASLEAMGRESSGRNTVRETLPGWRSAKGYRPVAGMHQADTDICASLAGKRITMIGGEHIYRLHLLLLQHRERAEEKPFPCPYHEFCTHHHICLPLRNTRDAVPPPRYVKPPTTQELIDSASAAVNYIVSDTLLSARNESSWEYTLPFVDPLTGVRLRETYWLSAARKAHVVILGRGPLSAPGQTYAGNWSFLRDVPDYVDRLRGTIIADRLHTHRDDAHAYPTVPSSLEILNAAVYLTVSRFLPDVFQLLQSIRQEIRPGRQKRLIWPSSWYHLPGRGATRTLLLLGPQDRSPKTVQDMIQRTFFRRAWLRSSVTRQDMDVFTLHLSALITADDTGTAPLEDPWTLLFNAQVYLQNMVLAELLPRYGIVFLPLDVAPWVDKADRGGRGHPHWYGHEHGSDGYSRGTAMDVGAERLAAIGNEFLGGLNHVVRFLE